SVGPSRGDFARDLEGASGGRRAHRRQGPRGLSDHRGQDDPFRRPRAGAEGAPLARARMKLGITWGELAQTCGGRLSGDASARLDELSSDTRALKPGQAFWALKGASHDAHDFLEQALHAAGWIVRAGAKLPAKRPARLV